MNKKEVSTVFTRMVSITTTISEMVNKTKLSATQANLLSAVMDDVIVVIKILPVEYQQDHKESINE